MKPAPWWQKEVCSEARASMRSVVPSATSPNRAFFAATILLRSANDRVRPLRALIEITLLPLTKPDSDGA
jgi:hypothetical protein